MLTLGLWVERPDFGDLLLAHLYLKCPVVVPYYFPKEAGQSDEEFLKLNGYQLDESGNVEKQEKFIKRQSGLIRFFAALLITPATPAGAFRIASQRNLHPLPLAVGWKLLSDLLALPPKTDITAIAFYEVLQVRLLFLNEKQCQRQFCAFQITGYYLRKAYGNQFSKLLSILRLQYLPRIAEVTAADRRIALARLETLLEESRFTKPDGIIEF